MKIRVPLVWAKSLGWHVELPSYTMVPNSWQPQTPGIIEGDVVIYKIENNKNISQDEKALELNPTCEVIISEEIANDTLSGFDIKKIRSLYQDNPLWTRKDATIKCGHQ
jgi:hypothetical protein